MNGLKNSGERLTEQSEVDQETDSIGGNLLCLRREEIGVVCGLTLGTVF